MADQIEFYDVRKRAKVSVPTSDVKKKKFVRPTKSGGTQVRYAVVAEHDGTRLTKFVKESDYMSMNVPEVN